MICGEVVPKVVNTTVTTVSCYIAKVLIARLFLFYYPKHLCLEAIGGVRVTTTILNPNLEGKVFIEDESIIVNIAEQNKSLGPGNGFSWGQMIEQPKTRLLDYHWDPG